MPSVLDDENDDDGSLLEKHALEVTADQLADEEWGPVKEKGKKGKKGAGKKSKVHEEDDGEEPGMCFIVH